jgi:hypothetical protein
MAVLTHFTAKHNGKRSYVNRKVARSLKIRILPNAEQKELLAVRWDGEIPTTQAKALAEGVSDRARATAIAGWEAEHDGTCKGDRGEGVQQDEV